MTPLLRLSDGEIEALELLPIDEMGQMVTGRFSQVIERLTRDDDASGETIAFCDEWSGLADRYLRRFRLVEIQGAEGVGKAEVFYGPDHPETIAMRRNLAATSADVRKREAALQDCRDTFSRLRAALNG